MKKKEEKKKGLGRVRRADRDTTSLARSLPELFVRGEAFVLQPSRRLAGSEEGVWRRLAPMGVAGGFSAPLMG